MVIITPVTPTPAGLDRRLGTKTPSTQCVAVYARQSTEDQTSNDDQVRVDLEWAERNGLTVSPDHIYRDIESGQMASRPG